MTSSSVVEPSPALSAAVKFRRFLRRTLLLLLAGALVLGIGTVVSTVESPPPLSATEQARLDAFERISAVAGDLRHLASAENGPNNDDGRAAKLSAAASLLEQQAALFPLQTQPAGPPSVQPSAGPPPAATPPASGAAPSSSPAAEPTVDGTLSRLAATSRFLLAASADVEPGLSRLLASVGASAFGQAVALHRLYPESEQPQAWEPRLPNRPTECPGPGGGESAEPAPSAAAAVSVPDQAEAVSAVLASEYRMSFVYEAALPRLDGGLQRQASAFYAEHRALMARWEELAAAHCLDLPLRQPAYPLPGDVVAEPRQALAAAEADAARALGDLVAFGDDGLQQAAAAELAGSAVRLAVLAGEPALTPGLEAAEGGPGPTAAAKASGWALP